MNKLVEVTALVLHNNSYGPDFVKEQGDSYFVPRAVAKHLEQSGYVSIAAEDAPAKAKAKAG